MTEAAFGIESIQLMAQIVVSETDSIQFTTQAENMRFEIDSGFNPELYACYKLFDF